MLDSPVCGSNKCPAAESGASNAGSHSTGGRTDLSGSMARDQRAARLQCSARHRLQLLCVQDATSTGQL